MQKEGGRRRGIKLFYFVFIIFLSLSECKWQANQWSDILFRKEPLSEDRLGKMVDFRHF